MSIEAMKQALEALEYVKQTYDEQGLVSLGTNTAIIDLRQAIAEAEKQEPVAWWIPKAEQFCLPSSDGTRPFAKAWNPLYTTPQQRKPLTDEQIEQIENGIWRPEFFDDVERQANREFARAIEAAHGIKE